MLRRDKQRMTMDMRSWWVDGGDDPNGHHDLSTLSLSHDEVFSLPCLGETCLQKAQKPSSISWIRCDCQVLPPNDTEKIYKESSRYELPITTGSTMRIR